LTLYLSFSCDVGAANGKQGLIPEEMSQTLLTNKNQGIHALNIIKPTQTSIKREKTLFVL
jgi:hypothetical protein